MPFLQNSMQKTQQNETLYPTKTTHIPVDQGIFQIQVYPPQKCGG